MNTDGDHPLPERDYLSRKEVTRALNIRARTWRARRGHGAVVVAAMRWAIRSSARRSPWSPPTGRNTADGLRWSLRAAGGLFTLGRCAGWMAHILEHRMYGFMLRPRARFASLDEPVPD